MEFVRMVAATIFKATRFCVSFVIRPTTGHTIAFVKFVE
jgi:hypothetical protein